MALCDADILFYFTSCSFSECLFFWEFSSNKNKKKAKKIKKKSKTNKGSLKEKKKTLRIFVATKS